MMKNKLILSLILVLTMLNLNAQALLTQWNFNSNPVDGNTGTGNSTPSTGSGSLSIIGSVTPTFVSGALVAGAATGNATNDDSGLQTTNYPAQGTNNKTAGIEVAVSTVGKNGIKLAWLQRNSSTGSKFFRFQYSTNGTTFTDFGAAPFSFAANTNFQSFSVDLTGIPAVNNNANFKFRIVAEFDPATGTSYTGTTGTYATTGTSRFDMLTITSQPPTAILSGSATICQGSTFSMTVNLTGIAPWSITYTDGVTPQTVTGINATPYTFSITPTATATYTLTNVADLGNTSSSEVSGSASVTVNPLSPSVVAASGTTWEADWEYTDGTGWTHYLDNNGTPSNTCDDYILLSVKKDGNVIGAVGDGTFKVEVKGNGGVANVTPNSNYVQSADWYVMDRYWDVTPNPQPASDVSVRFYYTTADFNAVDAVAPSVAAHTDMKFYKINGAFDPNPALGHVGIPAATAYNASGYWQYDNGAMASTSAWEYGTFAGEHYGQYVISQFSGGGGGGGGAGGAFPIELLMLEGVANAATNALNWTTTTESNASHFEVMSSLDGTNFLKIGQVAATGNSTTPQNYQFVDTNPNGNMYYRLRMVDVDGTYALSHVINISRFDLVGKLIAYPNPSTGTLYVHVPAVDYATQVEITVTSLAGQTLYNEKIASFSSESTIETDFSTLPAGMYMLNVTKGNFNQSKMISIVR